MRYRLSASFARKAGLGVFVAASLLMSGVTLAVDTDGDTIDDAFDIDDDNDGILDVHAKVSKTLGKHFWQIFPKASNGEVKTVYVSGNPGTTVTIDGNAFTIPGSGVLSHTMDPAYPAINSAESGVAFKIDASADVAVTMEAYRDVTADGWTALPNKAIGTEYTVIGWANPIFATTVRLT